MQDLTGWYKFVNESPEIDNYVVVYRHNKNKYMIAKLIKLKTDDGLGDRIEWVTEYNNVHCPHDEDLWCPFPNLTMKKVVTVNDH